jgi:hypothetical protein
VIKTIPIKSTGIALNAFAFAIFFRSNSYFPSTHKSLSSVIIFFTNTNNFEHEYRFISLESRRTTLNLLFIWSSLFFSRAQKSSWGAQSVVLQAVVLADAVVRNK